MATLRMFSLTGLVAVAALCGVLIASALISVLVVAVKVLAVAAVVIGLTFTVRFLRAGRGIHVSPRRAAGLTFKVRQDLHLLRHLRADDHAHIEQVLRRHVCYSRQTCEAARRYLHHVKHVEPRLDLLAPHQAGDEVWPASDAADLLPHTGAARLLGLHLDPNGTEHAFEVQDQAGTVYRLHHWMADYLTTQAPALPATGSVTP